MLTWDETIRTILRQKKYHSFVRDCYFDKPLLRAAKRFYMSDEWKETKEFIQRYRLSHGKKAMDLGAGNGIASYALAKDGWDVTAVEPDNSSIVGREAIRNLSKQSAYPIRIVKAFGEHLSFKKNQFDLVYCRQVLHHAKDMNIMISQIWNILKPGGIFIAVREHVIRHPDDLQIFLSSHPLEKMYHGEHAYTVGVYKRTLIGAGFCLCKTIRPYDSAINMYPSTWAIIRNAIQRKIKINPPCYSIPILRFLHNTCMHYPGILYSFICRKPIT